MLHCPIKKEAVKKVGGGTAFFLTFRVRLSRMTSQVTTVYGQELAQPRTVNERSPRRRDVTKLGQPQSREAPPSAVTTRLARTGTIIRPHTITSVEARTRLEARVCSHAAPVCTQGSVYRLCIFVRPGAGPGTRGAGVDSQRPSKWAGPSPHSGTAGRTGVAVWR